jgi:hypothetical protein
MLDVLIPNVMAKIMDNVVIVCFILYSFLFKLFVYIVFALSGIKLFYRALGIGGCAFQTRTEHRARYIPFVDGRGTIASFPF